MDRQRVPEKFFNSPRELYAHMKDAGGVWLNYNDPRSRIIGYIDDHFKEFVRLRLTDYQNPESSLTEEEKSHLFRKDGILFHEHVLFGDAKLSPYQLYKLNGRYRQLMCNIMAQVYQSEVDKRSLLRTKGHVLELNEGNMIPQYENIQDAVYVAENGDNLETSTARNIIVPLFEISFNPEVKVETAYDFSIDAFLEKSMDAFVNAENEQYEKLRNHFGDENFSINVPVRTPITVLIADDYAAGCMGVSAFELIGIMAWRNKKE